jgi:hypothetical protein
MKKRFTSCPCIYDRTHLRAHGEGRKDDRSGEMREDAQDAFQIFPYGCHAALSFFVIRNANEQFFLHCAKNRADFFARYFVRTRGHEKFYPARRTVVD